MSIYQYPNETEKNANTGYLFPKEREEQDAQETVDEANQGDE